MAFSRDPYALLKLTIEDTGITDIFSGDIPVTSSVILYYFNVYVNDLTGVRSYDFETDEITGVGVIDLMLYGSVVRRLQIDRSNLKSPMMTMQDDAMPVNFIFLNAFVFNGLESYTSKIQRQDHIIDGDISLCAKKLRTQEDIEVNTLVMKHNGAFMSDVVICDQIRVRKRLTYQPPIDVEFFGFM